MGNDQFLTQRQVDSFAYLGLILDKIIEAPTQQEQDDEDYLRELEESGNAQQGRDPTTGYIHYDMQRLWTRENAGRDGKKPRFRKWL